MKKNDNNTKNPRREFLGSLAAGAATFGISTLATPLDLNATAASGVADADAWFDKVKGKHRVVFDVPAPHEIFPFAWPRAFLLSNIATGTPESDCGVVVVLRHIAIVFAMEDRLWAKYKFGEAFNVTDGITKAPAVRNPFWKPKPGDFKAPGLGNLAIGINELQESGVMFCVCDTAMTTISARMAPDGDTAEAKKDFVSGVLPNIQIVPAGVWALGRAQEKKCAYVFVG
jgi:intracellular sulfur oxidation DsrE/DsrF family protein